MTQGITKQQIHSSPLGIRMLQGAGIGLILISAFLLSAGEPNPEWPTYWMVRPIIIVPLAGAAGGVFFFMMDKFRIQGGWKKVVANIVTVIVCMFGLWIGTILGLDGTMWD